MLREEYRFKEEKVAYIQDGEYIERSVIVLKHIETEVIVAYTDYADYIFYKTDWDTAINSVDMGGFYAVLNFLNYLFIFHNEHYRVESLLEVTKEMVEDFVNDYSSKKMENGEYPSRDSVIKKRNGVCLFLETFAHYHDCAIKPKSLMKVRKLKNKEGYGLSKYIDYSVHIRFREARRDDLKHLIRDMPISIVSLFIHMAEIYDSGLTFAIVLSLYAGLREGEVCNVRQVTSEHPGIIITRQKDMDSNILYKPTAITLDLNKEYNLRNDFKNVGGIKRERIVHIYPPFVETVHKYYERHMTIIKDMPCSDYKPMFLNKNKHNGIHEAMTKSGYRERIIKLFNEHVLPACKDNADPKLSLFYYSMQNHTWGAHAFRHWFTVFLVVSGVDDVPTLQTLRGDSSPESARTYLRNKGILREKYTEAVQKLGLMIKGKGV